VNLSTIIELAYGHGKSKFSTLEFLTSYYQSEGKNVFKASELAEINIQNFIGYTQSHIATANKLNTVNVFDNVDSSITSFNQDYPIVQGIYKSLQALTWQDFEEFCGTLLKKCFKAESVIISQKSNDGGVDFSAKAPFKTPYTTNPFGFIELYGQAKKYSGNVGRVDIDKFTAFANRQKRDNQYPAQLFIFCTTSDYIQSALDEISKNNFISLNGQQIAFLIFNHMKSIDFKGDDYLSSFIQ